MPTLIDAAKLSQNPFTVTNFRAIATSDEVFGMLNFVPKGGESFSYTREKSVGSFGFIADNFAGTISQTTGSDEKVDVPKRQAVEDFYVDAFDQANQSGLVSQMDIQTTKKFKAAGRTLANKLINGRNNTGFTMADAFQSGAYVDAVTPGPWLDSSRNGQGLIRYTHAGTFVAFQAPGDKTFGPDVAAAADGDYLLRSDNPSKWIMVTLDVSDATANAVRAISFTSSGSEFDGLKYLISSGQTRSSVGATGDAVRLAILDELIHSVKVRTPGQMAFMCHSTVTQAIEGLMRSTSWNLPPLTIPGTAFSVPQYKQIPILTNDWITKDESKGGVSTLSSIYLVNMSANAGEGFWMGALGGQTFNVEADPRDVSVLGFQLTDLGAIQSGAGNKIGRRLAWYGAPALGSDLAAARAKEIVTV